MLRKFPSLYFGIGFAVGFLTFIAFFSKSKYSNEVCLKPEVPPRELENHLYDKWFTKTNYKRERMSIDQIRYGKNYQTDSQILTESQFLYEHVKVLCIVLVKDESKAKAANETWTSGCNNVHFVKTREQNKKMPTKKSKRMSMWVSLCKTLLSISEDYHWFLVVYDHSFVLMENLRRLVAGLDYNEGHYLGHAVSFWATLYNSGQAGYVLSKGSVLGFKHKFNTSESCVVGTTYLNQEDFYLGKVLASLQIYPADTRDSMGLTTFHTHVWQHEFFPGANIHKSSVYPVVCCSAQSVTAQVVDSIKLYTYYYLINQLQVFKTGTLGNRLPPTIPSEKIWGAFLKERGLENATVSAEQYYNLWLEVVNEPSVFARHIANRKYEYLDN